MSKAITVNASRELTKNSLEKGYFYGKLNYSLTHGYSVDILGGVQRILDDFYVSGGTNRPFLPDFNIKKQMKILERVDGTKMLDVMLTPAQLEYLLLCNTLDNRGRCRSTKIRQHVKNSIQKACTENTALIVKQEGRRDSIIRPIIIEKKTSKNPLEPIEYYTVLIAEEMLDCSLINDKRGPRIEYKNGGPSFFKNIAGLTALVGVFCQEYKYSTGKNINRKAILGLSRALFLSEIFNAKTVSGQQYMAIDKRDLAAIDGELVDPDSLFVNSKEKDKILGQLGAFFRWVNSELELPFNKLLPEEIKMQFNSKNEPARLNFYLKENPKIGYQA